MNAMYNKTSFIDNTRAEAGNLGDAPENYQRKGNIVNIVHPRVAHPWITI